MTRYDYDTIRAKALHPDATAEDRIALMEWLDAYDASAWNGEYYDIDDGLRLYPIEKPIAFEDDGTPYEWEYVDAEVR